MGCHFFCIKKPPLRTKAVYLYRVSGDNILSIGAPSNSRPTKILKSTPGIFIEFFPLVSELDSNDTYFDVLQRIKLETNKYLRHAQSGMSNSDLNKSYNVTLNFINTSFSNFQVYSNPNLNCISVDNATWASNNWTTANSSINSHMSFSNNCPGGFEDFTNSNAQFVIINDKILCLYL